MLDPSGNRKLDKTRQSEVSRKGLHVRVCVCVSGKALAVELACKKWVSWTTRVHVRMWRLA